MSNQATINYEEAVEELAEEAGLIFSGRNDDGEIEWLGTGKSWRKFEDLLTNKQ